MADSRLSSHEIAERGEALFQRNIRPLLHATDRGKFLVLDIETGDYEIDHDELAALGRMHAKSPSTQLYALRIGHPTAYQLRESVFQEEREASRTDSDDFDVPAEEHEWEAVIGDGVA